MIINLERPDSWPEPLVSYFAAHHDALPGWEKRSSGWAGRVNRPRAGHVRCASCLLTRRGLEMSVTDTNDVLWAELRAAYDRLAAPGLLGVHQRFEATEIVAFRPGRKPPLNALTILVAEEGDPLESLFLTGINGPKLLHIPLLKEWGFGIFRYRLGIDELGRHLDALSSSTEWSPSGKALEIGAMKAVPLHFVPADGLGPVPLNRILKNNFGTGAYVLEWAAPGSPALQPFFDEPQRLQQLSEAIGRFIPINLAGLSDRLGSICVQIPVTAVAVAIAHSADDRIVGEIAWHPAVPPRAVRVTCEFEFDNTVRGYGSVETQQGQFQLSIGAEL